MPRHHQSTTELRHVDPQIWRACVGSTVHPPAPNSLVYYFPQGHLEQQSSQSPLSKSATSRPIILCHVASTQLLVDPLSDECFAKLTLNPINSNGNINADVTLSLNSNGNINADVSNGVDSYAKILTPSDANNGGGFSVPRFCADAIFPKLDYDVQPPLQTLAVRDLRGFVWNFRHIYRGAPRRHLLTTGWSRFVNSKKLIAGDSVVFIKSGNGNGDMSIGVKRVARPKVSLSGEFAKWFKGCEEERGKLGFGSVSGESVVRAIERAVQGLAFEVVYYPKAVWSDFVVRVEVVEEALRVGWGAGLRVKMGVESEHFSRLNWLQGTVKGVCVPHNLPWFNSPWRMLQVSWDDPEATHLPSRVNPWQVEVLDPVPPIIHSTLPPSKKFRLSQSSDLFREREAEFFFPMSKLYNFTMNQSNLSLLRSNSFTASMQGARQSSFHFPSLSNTITGSTANMCSDIFLGNNMAQNSGSLSTELNIGSSHSGNLSPSSQSSVQSTAEKNSGKSSTKVCVNSFQLFGQIIHVQPDQSPPINDFGRVEDEVAKKLAEYGDSGITTLDLSLTSPLTDKTNSSGVCDS